MVRRLSSLARLESKIIDAMRSPSTRRFSSPRRAVVMLAAAALSVGCASRPGPPPDPLAGLAHWGQVPPVVPGRSKADPTALSALGERLRVGMETAQAHARTAQDAGGAPDKSFEALDILILSGGGSHGAYGAGLLVGWTTEGTRPEFDVVTGVSTGGLMATHAFLGSDWDPELERLYTTIRNRDIYRPRTPLLRFFGDALNDTKPLERLLEREITAETLDAVAIEFRRGRQLYVASTNLDSGELAIWDLGRIAAAEHRSMDERLRAYRRALLASAAIPVFFPPVYVEVADAVTGRTYAQMHVDGGAQGPIFFRDFMTDLREALAAAGMVTSPASDNLWLVVNGTIGLDGTAPKLGPNLLAIAGRSVEIVYAGQTFGHVYRVYRRAEALGYRFNLTSIPDDFASFPAKDFVPADMTRLFELGRAAAISGTAWRQDPPDLDASEYAASGVVPRG